jgi:hypothetical protein
LARNHRKSYTSLSPDQLCNIIAFNNIGQQKNETLKSSQKFVGRAETPKHCRGNQLPCPHKQNGQLFCSVEKLQKHLNEKLKIHVIPVEGA